MIFGDLFLDDIRAYREQALGGLGDHRRCFRLWQRPTDELAREMLDSGIRAVLTCVDPLSSHAEFAGRAFDARFLADLPSGVDPCGERGEFHTFVWDAPVFAHPSTSR